MSNLSLQNIDNYKSEHDSSVSEIFAKYNGLVTLYITRCAESVSIRNINYLKYIICNGLETLNHVFKLLLLYTKDMTTPVSRNRDLLTC